MITPGDALDRLIEACPSFLGATDLYEYMAWSEEEGVPDPYVRAAAFSLHVVRLIEARQVDELPGVAAAIEQILDDGDRDARDLVRLGLLESLQNICSHDDVRVGADELYPLLGPNAAEVWNELYDLWARATRSVEAVPRASEADYLGVADPNLRIYFRTGKRKLPDGSLATASDILRYETAVADATWRSPEARRRANRISLAVGLVLALAVAIAVFRP